MAEDPVLDVLRGEAEQLTRALTGLSEQDWDRPTACTPWRVRDLLAHIRVVIAWLPGMLIAQPPARAKVDARAYYRPDERFAPDTNTTRIRLAREHTAAHDTGAALVEDFRINWQQVDKLCRAEPPDRVVRTRHGDPMLLTEFLRTRVVEVAVHGLDLAAALDRRPWLTAPAAELVEDLLGGSTARRALGWDRLTFLLKATGRTPITPAETEQINHLGIQWLTLG
ncbi:maleylpyruvate isomerase N-terminal domain-containing protein [Micromonospora sp. NBC_01796]|uniref:maleylpyruvate isomerase N-terminal domain-containing protein n=1 Tax=Micromonospora sp. NBC_01796 TaxID=2975987 RepID=UPI002DD952BD|nr:maleylpyruvate isomerase N-terminal domain-containing protein [Micromonospora sp. NBC_01796]WSA82915.1 maleylpyruvate isomerase N-terminal domain-containing protein [Micromonospora sp. NBC_01796]